ncbi:hypothetical protein A1O1_06517 [Capronia coronata CBS 617.96]|uniref:Preprotein translocase subunit YidC n=1 Tax=Capronia coronata CBS 617.96 TaxID=1182541 RepID=W9Y005_9EURO|nr:uncharacterized protein A1O1_06517 [Capronia coronata CBS 617.96]EXJ86147.1 hypothetical protein A1O1_06517 [Capronia coronata CBS 617.96]
MLPRQSRRCTTTVRAASLFLEPQSCARTALRRHAFARTFHSSRPHRILAEALQLSHSAFEDVHTLSGLPWCLSIPLTASLFRLAWIPVQVISTISLKRRQIEGPLLKGWRKAYQDIAVVKFRDQTQQTAEKAEAWVSKQLQARRKAIRKHSNYMSPLSIFGLQLSFLPIWILNADVIRRMAGDDRTLLSLLVSTDHNKVDTTVIPPEPGLQAESLWWIPDLVSPDHLWILPLMFGALSVASAWMAAGRGMAKQQVKISTMEHGVAKQREIFFLSVSQFIVAASFLFPVFIIRSETATAVVLYLIGSVGTQLVQRPLVSYLLGDPKKSAIEPLERKAPRLKGTRDTR